MVKRFYEAGATLVEVVVMEIDRGGGKDYADSLEVTFPKEKIEEVVSVVKSLRPDNWEEDLEEGKNVNSVYEDYVNSAKADPLESLTTVLWWD